MGNELKKGSVFSLNQETIDKFVVTDVTIVDNSKYIIAMPLVYKDNKKELAKDKVLAFAVNEKGEIAVETDLEILKKVVKSIIAQ